MKSFYGYKDIYVIQKCLWPQRADINPDFCFNLKIVKLSFNKNSNEISTHLSFIVYEKIKFDVEMGIRVLMYLTLQLKGDIKIVMLYGCILRDE